MIRELGPEWSKNSTLMFTGRDEKGNIRYVDTGRYNQLSIMNQVFTALNRGDVKGALLAPGSTFMTESFAVQEIVDIIRGVDSRGKEVYSKVDTPFDKVWKSVGHLYNSNKTGYQKFFEDATKAYDEKETFAGTPYTYEDAMLGFLGYKEQTINVERNLKFKAKDIKDRIYSSKKLYWTGKYNTSDEEAVVKANEALEREYQKAHDLYNKLIEGGMSDEQIKAIFTSEGVGFNNKYFRKITNNEPEVMMTEKDEEAMKKAKQDME